MGQYNCQQMRQNIYIYIYIFLKTNEFKASGLSEELNTNFVDVVLLYLERFVAYKD